MLDCAYGEKGRENVIVDIAQVNEFVCIKTTRNQATCTFIVCVEYS